MFSTFYLLLASLAYVVFLFFIAYRGDKKRAKPLPPIAYALAIGTYCTSWTFYGAVGTAANVGWGFLPIYLGPAISFLAFWAVFKKIGTLTDVHGISSIADFIATRYGKARSIAVLITMMALLVVVPYIALQLKAISTAWSTLTGQAGTGTPALIATLLMTIFAVAFGTGRLNRREHHRGLMLSLAVESGFKLFAFAAVAIGITALNFGDFGGLIHAASVAPAAQALFTTDFTAPLFLSQTILAALAVFCLPRQFQLSFVESGGAERTDLARWAMPVYLAMFALLVIPMAAAGMLLLPEQANPDLYVLLLPLSAGLESLTLLAYLGGLSAGIAMIIAATMALSTMVCNEWVVPYYASRADHDTNDDLSEVILASRRWAIVLIMLLAYVYHELATGGVSLASTGLLAFVAAAQFAPSLLIGLYWRQANRYGAIAGLLLGGGIWGLSLAIPAWSGMTQAQAIAWNDGLGLVGLANLDPITHTTLWSLGVNLIAFVLVSLLTRPNFNDRMQASVVVDSNALMTAPRAWRGQLSVGDLEILLARYLGEQASQVAWQEIKDQLNDPLDKLQSEASPQLYGLVERRLAQVMGASSARLVLDSRARGRMVKADELVSVVEESNRALQTSREQLTAALENLATGVSVVDAQLRLVAWNRRYQQIFDYDEELLQVGRPIADLIRYNAERNFFGEGNVDVQVKRRLDHLESGRSHRRITYLPNGTVIEISGNPMPDGGFVTSFYDITELKRNEQALQASEANIRLYTDSLPSMLSYLDNDCRVLFVNQAFENILGMPRETILGRYTWEIFSEHEYKQRQPHIERALKGQSSSFELMIEYQGNAHHYEAIYTPHTKDEHVIGVFIMYQDITQRREAEIQLKEANETLEERVAQRTQEISQVNSQLMRENQIRALTETQLQQAKQEAEQANLSKTRFLAAASHDLMQPLNAARLFTSALQNRLTGEAETLAQNLDSSLDNAEELLGTLLEISKLDAGATKPNLQPVNLVDIMSTLKVEFSALAQEKGIKLSARPREAWVMADPLMLRRILQNFLSNALRYTRQGGVLMGARIGSDKVTVQVWDSGIGIPERDQSRVFEEFARLESGRAQHDKGMGLGLSISIRLARLIGAELNLRSKENKGTVFSLSLPLTQERAAPKPANPLGRRSKASLAGLDVLCVDNEPMILEGMAKLLGDWGCQVRCCADQDAVLASIKESGAPDLLILDYHLDNDVTGLDVLDAVKDTLDRPPASILLTADRTEETADKATAAGARIMNKPVRPAALRALMSALKRS